MKHTPMQYTATIKRVDFRPMNVIPSELTVWITDTVSGEEGRIFETGSIEKLQDKFDFDIPSPSVWDFKRMIGRQAIVDKDGYSYTFLRYI